MALLDGLTEETPILGASGEELARRNALRPGTRGYNLGLGATNAPRVPDQPILGAVPSGLSVTPGLDAAKADIASRPPDMPSMPVLGRPTSGSAGILGNSAPQPSLPAPPQRSDYKTRDLTTTEKILTPILGVLGGARGAETILGRPRAESERSYSQAMTDYNSGVGAAKTQEGLEQERANTEQKRALAEQERARADALRNPQPKADRTVAPETDDYYSLLDQVNPATGKPFTSQEALEQVKSAGKTDKPVKENKAVAGTVAGVPAWGVQTDKGWIDPQTQKPIPSFRPAPNYAQVAPQMRSVNVLRNGTVMAIHPDDLKPGDVLAGAAAGEHAMTKTATMEDIRNSLTNVKDKAKVLDAGFKDRAILAAALGDPNTTLSSFAQSGIRNRLSPEEEDYVIAVLNAREQIAGLRSLLGANQASDARMKLMLQTIPGAGTGNSVFAGKQIDRALKDLELLQKGIPKMPGQRGSADQPPGPPAPGMKWRQNTRTKEYRQVPIG